MNSYTDVSGRSCGQRSVPASNCLSNQWGSAATPEASFTQPGGMACTQTAPGCLEQQFPVAMAYVPWQQWQTTYAPERGLLQGTIFPDLDLEFNYGRCGR